MRTSFLPRACAAALLLVVSAVAPTVAHADDPPGLPADPSLGPLLARLTHHAEQFEQMKKRGSYTLSGHMDELDGGGRVDGTKEVVVRVTATPAERSTQILKYLEDGEDKTEEARAKEKKRRAEPPKDEKRSKMSDLHLPFLQSEQPRYTFSIVGRDLQRNLTRIAFQPKVPAEDAIHGSAWIDDAKGEVLTLGFSPSKNPTFIDHIDVTIRFDLQTALGRAPSSLTFDARGGFLVVRKHYRGSATVSDAQVSF